MSKSPPTPEARLRPLGIELPPAPASAASHVQAVRVGRLLFLAGHGPGRDGRMAYVGQVGRDLSVDEGREAARLAGLNLLATVREALGSLNRVRRIVKVLGMVNAPDGFRDHPRVIDGFSDLMVDVFGEAGRHARSAVGAASLPGGSAVEIEMIVEVSAVARRRAATRPRTAGGSTPPPHRAAAGRGR